MAEPAGDPLVREQGLRAIEAGRDGPILVASDERKARPNARQCFVDELRQRDQAHPDQIAVLHRLERARIEAQRRASAELTFDERHTAVVIAEQGQASTPDEARRREWAIDARAVVHAERAQPDRDRAQRDGQQIHGEPSASARS